MSDANQSSSLNVQNIIIGIVIVIVIYLLYIWFFQDSSRSHLVSMHNANKPLVVTGDNVPHGASADYTYAFWVYISNWSVGNKKVILARGKDGQIPAPEISLGAMLNNIEVTLGTYADGHSGDAINHTCTLENVPLQAWACVLVTLNNRSLDIYLDGKLVRTCVLPGVPKMTSGSPLIVTPGGGFDGYVSNLIYYSRAVNPREAYAIYREGPAGSNWLSNIFNKYRLRLEFLKDGKVVNEFDI